MKLTKKLAVLIASLVSILAITTTSFAGYSGSVLKGLAADDIYSAFQAETYMESAYGLENVYEAEGYRLGQWVYWRIGTPPAAIINQSKNIGDTYEWAYGTDISNNFEENFACYYRDYYSLKNYFNNNHFLGEETYSRLVEDATFMGVSNPHAEIRNMYYDLQIFITNCNNIVRGKY